MANTFYLQFVFAVKGRQNLIPKEHKEELHRYITALVQHRQVKMLGVNSMPDHIHLFVGFKPTVLISDFVKEIKVESNEFINSKNWVRGKFSLAGGLWCIFVFAITYRQCSKIYFKSRTASSKENI